jgi:hypothetical protein
LLGADLSGDGADSIIQDGSYTAAQITTILNRGVIQIAGGILLPGFTAVSPPLLDLYDSDTVNTSTTLPYVALPSDFQRNLELVASAAQDAEIRLYDSWKKFLKAYPNLNETGDSVEACVVHRGRLYYQPIPSSSEALTVHFYRKPVAMSATSDTPDGIPDHLAYDALTAFAAKEIYKLIEDGIEGRRGNYEYYMAEFIKAMLEITHFVGWDGVSLTYEDESTYTDDF